MTERISVRVPSDIKYSDLVHSISRQICFNMNFCDRDIHFVLLSVSEGFTNAVVHGNCSEPGREVVITYEIAQGILSIAIEDEGVLPIEENTGHAREMPRTEDESGRGVSLIRQFADEFTLVNVPKRGNILTMIFSVNNKSREAAEVHGEA